MDLNKLSIATEVESRQEQWVQDRLGKFTASRFGDLMKQGRKKNERWGVAAVKYIYEVISEILTNQPHVVTSKSMAWGEEYEPEAVGYFIGTTDYEVIYLSNVFVPYNEISGSSPDGYIGKDGILEIKCPYVSANHVSLIFGEPIPDTHIWQIQGNLMTTKRKWCKYVSYDPRMPEGLMMEIRHVERDNAMIRELSYRIRAAKMKLTALMRKLEKERNYRG